MNDELAAALSDAEATANELERLVLEREAAARRPFLLEAERIREEAEVLRRNVEVLEAERLSLATTVLDAETAQLQAERRNQRVLQHLRGFGLWTGRVAMGLALAVGASMLWQQTHSAAAFLGALVAVPISMALAFTLGAWPRG